MTINIELTEADVKQLVLKHLSTLLEFELTDKDVKIEVKSRQNYKSEWEEAAFRARVVRLATP